MKVFSDMGVVEVMETDSKALTNNFIEKIIHGRLIQCLKGMK